VRPGPHRKAPEKDDQQTRQRLISVATRLFGTLGFAHATIRDIAREARANVAAVNYHFRDKVGLYEEVLESAFDLIRELTDRAKEQGKGKSPEEKLKAYIRVHCEAMFATTAPSLLQQLIHQEMQQPTQGILDRLFERTMKPRFEYLYSVVGEILELPAGDERIKLSAITIHGMILMFRPNPIVQRFSARMKIEFDRERVTEHVIAFSLAALEVYRTRPRRPR